MNSSPKWQVESLRNDFSHLADVMIETNIYDNQSCPKITYLYCKGMIDIHLFLKTTLPELSDIVTQNQTSEQILLEAKNRFQFQLIQDKPTLYNQIFCGRLMIFFEAMNCIYALDIANIPKRDPEESNTEISIKGPKDAFTEEIETNVALVRKRLKTPSLYHEQFHIGQSSTTAVSLLYIHNTIKPELIHMVRERLNQMNIDNLTNSNQLEQGLVNSSYSLFPLINYVGRPDFVAECLIKGRFAILINGSPMALIAPSNLMFQMKTPEDSYFPYYFVTLERIIRGIGLFIAVMAPGFWISLTSYNMEQIPFPLLATVTVSRLGIPLPPGLEAFLMIGLFELFRESSLRLPAPIGQTVAVVGGLIVGNAAISSGLVSSTILFVVAVSAVATFTLVNQSLNGSVTVLRLFVLFLSSLLGIFGFYISLFLILIYMSNLKSFGIGYLEPLSPLTLKDIVSALFAKPNVKNNTQPDMLKKNEITSRYTK